MTPIREEIVHIKGHPKNMVIFLHGYIDTAEAVEEKIKHLINGLDDIVVKIPFSPYSCELHPEKKQWYSMHRFDPNDDRKTVKTMEKSSAIYDQMGLGLLEAHSYLLPYIKNSLQEYDMTEKNLFLCGFSQGASLAIYTSLLFDERIKGCISFSGMIAPHTYLKNNYISKPDVLLIHGAVDNIVRYEAMDFTKKHLKQIGCSVETITIANGNHRIYEEGVKAAAEFIKKRI